MSIGLDQVDARVSGPCRLGGGQAFLTGPGVGRFIFLTPPGDRRSKIVATTYKPYVPSRMLWQTHDLKRGYAARCYRIYGMPFELHLSR